MYLICRSSSVTGPKKSPPGRPNCWILTRLCSVWPKWQLYSTGQSSVCFGAGDEDDDGRLYGGTLQAD